MRILLKDKNVIAVEKVAGMPSQSDPTGDKDAMSTTSEDLAALGEKGDLWLVHRLDRVVGGVLVFARNKQSAAELSSAVADKTALKEYLAVVEGDAEEGEMVDLLFKDSKKSKAFVVQRARAGVKEAKLEYYKVASVDTEKGIRTLVRIKLHTGRFHQIRAQFSSRAMPIVGDGKYGSHDNKANMPALFACKMAFKCAGKTYSPCAIPDVESYPWNLFSKEIYTELV